MPDYLIKEETLTNIADAIREKTGATDLLAPEDMNEAIDRLETDLMNQYIWEKCDVDYSYTTSTITSGRCSDKQTKKRLTCKTGTGYKINSNGQFELTGTITSRSVTYGSNYSTWPAGVYWIGNLGTTGNSLYFTTTASQIGCSVDAINTYMNVNYGTNSNVTCYNNLTESSVHYDWVNSSNSTAYPPAISDGYTYKSMGKIEDILNDNLLNPIKILNIQDTTGNGKKFYNSY